MVYVRISFSVVFVHVTKFPFRCCSDGSALHPPPGKWTTFSEFASEKLPTAGTILCSENKSFYAPFREFCLPPKLAQWRLTGGLLHAVRR